MSPPPCDPEAWRNQEAAKLDSGQVWVSGGSRSLLSGSGMWGLSPRGFQARV